MKTIKIYGIMRGGIHVFTGWLINKLPNKSVLYYNNIRDPEQLDDRLIQTIDTRIDPIRNKLTTDIHNAQYTIKSFESKPLNIDDKQMYDDKPQEIIILRNPYNVLASSLKYQQVDGRSPDVLSDERLLKLWKIYAHEFLHGKKIIVLYDYFIMDSHYRKKIAEKLSLPIYPDKLLTLGMGGGSSFDPKNNNYTTRDVLYNNHPMMIKFKHDSELSNLWSRVQN